MVHSWRPRPGLPSPALRAALRRFQPRRTTRLCPDGTENTRTMRGCRGRSRSSTGRAGPFSRHATVSTRPPRHSARRFLGQWSRRWTIGPRSAQVFIRRKSARSVPGPPSGLGFTSRASPAWGRLWKSSKCRARAASRFSAGYRRSTYWSVTSSPVTLCQDFFGYP